MPRFCSLHRGWVFRDAAPKQPEPPWPCRPPPRPEPQLRERCLGGRESIRVTCNLPNDEAKAPSSTTTSRAAGRGKASSTRRSLPQSGPMKKVDNAHRSCRPARSEHTTNSWASGVRNRTDYLPRLRACKSHARRVRVRASAGTDTAVGARIVASKCGALASRLVPSSKPCLELVTRAQMAARGCSGWSV